MNLNIDYTPINKDLCDKLARRSKYRNTRKAKSKSIKDNVTKAMHNDQARHDS